MPGVMPLTIMDAKRRARWSELRTKGQGRFLLVEGVLKAGGMFAVLTLIVNYFRKNGFTASALSEYLSSGETIFEFVFGWLFFGFFMGLFVWYVGERGFKKSEKGQNEVQDSTSREA